jgi:hypothetical protein
MIAVSRLNGHLYKVQSSRLIVQDVFDQHHEYKLCVYTKDCWVSGLMGLSSILKEHNISKTGPVSVLI